MTHDPPGRTAHLLAVVSGAGWLLGVVALGSLVGYLLFGWVELVVTAGFLATLLSVSLLFLLGQSTVTATIDLGSRRTVVGERFTGRVVVRNVGARRALPARIELTVDAARQAFVVPSLKSGGEYETELPLPTVRRGLVAVGPVTAVRTDPLGLMRRERLIAAEQTLYVHPATIRVDPLTAGSVLDPDGRAVRELSDSDVAFHGIREYEAGDDRRFIHWKSTARTGSLMVRQFEQTRRSQLVIVLSTRAAEYATEADFETAVSVAGSVAVATLAEGESVTVASAAQTVTTAGGGNLLDALASAAQGADDPPLADLTRRLAAVTGRAGLVVLVCGGDVDAEELRRARHQLTGDLRTVVVQCGTAGSRRRIQGVELMAVRSLEHLPRARRGLR